MRVCVCARATACARNACGWGAPSTYFPATRAITLARIPSSIAAAPPARSLREAFASRDQVPCGPRKMLAAIARATARRGSGVAGRSIAPILQRPAAAAAARAAAQTQGQTRTSCRRLAPMPATSRFFLWGNSATPASDDPGSKVLYSAHPPSRCFLSSCMSGRSFHGCVVASSVP